MPQNAVTTRDESEHFLFESLEPSAFCPAANSQAKNESNSEEILDPSLGAYKLPHKKTDMRQLSRRLLLMSTIQIASIGV